MINSQLFVASMISAAMWTACSTTSDTTPKDDDNICANDPDCKERGKCNQLPDGECAPATVEDCLQSVACSFCGYCGIEQGPKGRAVCAPSSGLDCASNEGCPANGWCETVIYEGRKYCCSDPEGFFCCIAN